ncbi:11477_t:CDS:2, partial [Acaulospora colombiana]
GLILVFVLVSCPLTRIRPSCPFRHPLYQHTRPDGLFAAVKVGKVVLLLVTRRISEQSKVEEEDEKETQSFTLEDALMSSLGRGITQENVGMGAADEVEKEQVVQTERKRMIRNSSGSYLVNARGWRATQTGGLPSPLTREGGEGEDDIRLTEAATDVRRATSSATGETGERRGNGDLLRVKSDG